MNMKKKIVGISFCTLLIIATVLPVLGIINNNINNECIIENQVESELQYSNTNMADEWPMFLHDPERTGYSTSSAPRTNTTKWVYTTGGNLESSPAVVNGKVYIGSVDENIYCLDAYTGEKLWDYYIYELDACSPAVYDGKVYISNTHDHLYCLDADTGDEIWKFYKGDGVSRPSPAVFGGRVYFAHSRAISSGQDAYLYCLDADTGDIFWDYNLGFYELSSPTVSHGKVYIGSEDNKMYCFAADTGNLLWNFSTGWRAYFTPLVFNGKVCFGSDAVYCLDADNGTEIWNFTIGTGDPRMTSSPAVAYGNIYILSAFEGLYCLDGNTGEQIWNCNVGGGYTSSPVVADGKVYVGIWETGKLLCVNASTGEKLWEYDMNSVKWLFGSPAVAYGRLYYGGGLTRNVYCFKDPFLPSPSIKGPTDCITNHSYIFSIKATDPEDNDVKYYIDWDDGTTSGWIGPHPSGDWITVNHTWSKVGTYSIRARVEYANGIRSNWSEPHNITVIDAPLLKIQSIKGGLFKVNTVIKNQGTLDATRMNWSIELIGGLILLGKETTGTGNIPIGEETTVTSKPIVGFGQTAVTVNATVPIGFSDTQDRKAFAVLFFIMVKPGG